MRPPAHTHPLSGKPPAKHISSLYPGCCRERKEGRIFAASALIPDSVGLHDRRAAQWYEHLPESGDRERREFFRGEQIIDLINSTELGAVGVDVIAEAGVNDPDSLIKWELTRNDETEALSWCR